MNKEIETKAAQFPEKEYINGIFIAVYTCPRMSCIWSVSRLVRSLERPASQSRPRWGKEYLQMKVTCQNSCSFVRI